jgi:TatD DNase family protein
MSHKADGWIDSHIHLDCLGPPEAVAVAAEVAAGAGVRGYVVPGIDPEGWPRLLATVRSVTGAMAAPGVHPQAALCWDAATATALEGLIATEGVVAVGEIGLDGYVEVPAAAQEAALRGQLRLAVAAGLPLLIHCRRATERLLRILDEEDARRVGGIFHGFSGSVETALAVVRRGFAIGFGGPLTYPEARRAPEVLRALPAEWVVVETDAPDLPPHPYRGTPNRPELLPLIGASVAALRGWSLDETRKITAANTCRVLRLSASQVAPLSRGPEES